ncbi:hypothetical protein CDAR_440081 [Caerostris darwini]|uniref:Uncharacterized protein n=1 Tax=Caerostris darwini TaxID=1538125 RepID=A0AAV4RI08_9ARAC|nr:hypothetical protein CDAR_440081 [Caerostris darwini]
MRNSLPNGAGAFLESGEALSAGRLEISRRDRAGRKNSGIIRLDLEKRNLNFWLMVGEIDFGIYSSERLFSSEGCSFLMYFGRVVIV